ncbi:MAG: hypothetical protein JSV96_06905 [Candidatus Aminicenantes bacterium]|nr:MAG: hypothetical protein JSV96_06905 [Candidatus Aminicenantes bacterium]
MRKSSRGERAWLPEEEREPRTQEKGADVMSLSLALDSDYPEILEASKYCWKRNISIISAVAGTAALVLSAFERAKMQTLKEKPGSLVKAVRSILRRASSNKKLGYEAPDPASGFGLLDTFRAFRLAKGLKTEE